MPPCPSLVRASRLYLPSVAGLVFDSWPSSVGSLRTRDSVDLADGERAVETFGSDNRPHAHDS